jgi:hypothetical protein
MVILNCPEASCFGAEIYAIVPGNVKLTFNNIAWKKAGLPTGHLPVTRRESIIVVTSQCQPYRSPLKISLCTIFSGSGRK